MYHKLVVVILTYNEEMHIERAIKNVMNWCDKIIVLDSHSQDKTVAMAQKLGVEVIFRKFDNYKNQRQFAIDYCKDKTEWMLFLDADEYLLDDLKNEIAVAIKNKNIAGYYLPRRFIFMDKWIKHGGYYPSYFLRLFQPQTAEIDGIINEHVIVNGPVKKLQYDFVDHNLKGINCWVEKHNKYTHLEALNLWNSKLKDIKHSKTNFRIQSERKKWIREKIWNRLPLLLRPFLYFTHRYFFRLGFLDGKAGFIYHLLQGGWLWFMVDVKYIELKMENNQTAE